MQRDYLAGRSDTGGELCAVSTWVIAWCQWEDVLCAFIMCAGSAECVFSCVIADIGNKCGDAGRCLLAHVVFFSED